MVSTKNQSMLLYHFSTFSKRKKGKLVEKVVAQLIIGKISAKITISNQGTSLTYQGYLLKKYQ